MIVVVQNSELKTLGPYCLKFETFKTDKQETTRSTTFEVMALTLALSEELSDENLQKLIDSCKTKRLERTLSEMSQDQTGRFVVHVHSQLYVSTYTKARGK